MQTKTRSLQLFAYYPVEHYTNTRGTIGNYPAGTIHDWLDKWDSLY